MYFFELLKIKYHRIDQNLLAKMRKILSVNNNIKIISLELKNQLADILTCLALLWRIKWIFYFLDNKIVAKIVQNVSLQ